MNTEELLCKCREWVIAGKDIACYKVEDLPHDMNLWKEYHDCQELTVYQFKKGITRLYFIKNGTNKGTNRTIQNFSDNKGGEVQREEDYGTPDGIFEMDFDTTEF